MRDHTAALPWRPWAPDPPGRVNLRTLVVIRWVAVAGQLVTLLMVRYGLGFALPMIPALGIVALSAILNLAVTLTRPLSRRLSDRAAALYLGYDIVQLTALLFLTGGLENPFSLLILAPVTVSATALSRTSTMVLGALSVLCITLIALWHLPFPWNGDGFDLPELYLTAIWEAMVLGTLFIAAYVGSVSEEARKLSDALAATQMALSREQRLSELGALAAAAAHELGSPLATIAVTAKEMAHDVASDSPLAKDVELLLSQSERCREILAGLARRPQADAGKPYMRLPVSALAEVAAHPHRTEGIDLRFDARAAEGSADGAEPEVPRSPEIIHGLGNLVQNAVQFASAQAEVVTRWDRDSIWITVRDDGPGFPAGLLDRLGEPYLSSREGAGHMGLGVFIAKTLLERTGARVRFANAAGGGAVVTVRWPRRALEETVEDHNRD